MQVTGQNAISKLKEIVGEKEPNKQQKDSLRSFYAQDRVDNAFYVSETIWESAVDQNMLF